MNFQDKVFESTADFRTRAASLATASLATARKRANVAAERASTLGRHSYGQPGLAHPTRTGQRDQPAGGQASAHLRDLVLTPDEACHLDGHHGAGRPRHC
jgi:hypothetical protein